MRSATYAILAEYQKKIGNDAPVDPARPCVITGQQVGLMGGPLLTISKIVSCILYAREIGATPIFWAATEDHDVHEVNHCTVLSERGDLKRYKVDLPESHFLEDIPLTSAHIEVIESFCQDFNVAPWDYGLTFSETMIRLFVRLFRGTGLLFIEPYMLRPLASDFFQKELAETQTLPPGPIHHKPTDTHLFLKTEEGIRRKIRKGEDLQHLPPERFSTNVATRPVLQTLLFDPAAYIAGPTEIAYHAQLHAIFAAHGVKMPTLIPRQRYTLIPDVPQTSHCMQNLLRPRNRPQERVLNWFYFRTGLEQLFAEWHPGASVTLRLR